MPLPARGKSAHVARTVWLIASTKSSVRPPKTVRALSHNTRLLHLPLPLPVFQPNRMYIYAGLQYLKPVLFTAVGRVHPGRCSKVGAESDHARWLCASWFVLSHRLRVPMRGGDQVNLSRTGPSWLRAFRTHATSRSSSCFSRPDKVWDWHQPRAHPDF